jgi:hypothetical protein
MPASIKSLCTREASIVVVGVLVTTRMEKTTTTVMVEMGTNTIRGMATTIMAT